MSAPAISNGHADLVVIGGGIFGCSIAWHYARLGVGRVTLLERVGQIAPRHSVRACPYLLNVHHHRSGFETSHFSRQAQDGLTGCRIKPETQGFQTAVGTTSAPAKRWSTSSRPN